MAGDAWQRKVGEGQTLRHFHTRVTNGLMHIKSKCLLPKREKPWKVGKIWQYYSSVQLLSCVRLCDPMDCSSPGFPVHHQLLEPIQIHVHPACDAIQPSHPPSSPSPSAFRLSQHKDLFQWFSSLHQAAKVLDFQL